VQLTTPDLSRQQAGQRATAAIAREGEGSGILTADESATVIAQFARVDPAIVNEAIPAFFIGRNREGFWVARDVKGQIGRIFLFEGSARSFARRNSWPSGCATIFPSERFELDLENQGNPLGARLGSLMHLPVRLARQMAGFKAKMTEAIKRRLKGLHVL
jgi:hypothetical protein